MPACNQIKMTAAAAALHQVESELTDSKFAATRQLSNTLERNNLIFFNASDETCGRISSIFFMILLAFFVHLPHFL